MEHVTVSVFSPYPDLLPLDEFIVNPELEALSYSTQLGGFDRARVGLLSSALYEAPTVYPYYHRALRLVHGAHVEIRVGRLLLYEGAITTIAPNFQGFECLGYGRWAARYGQLTIGGESLLSSEIMASHAIQRVAWLVPGRIDETQTFHTWAEMQYRNANDLLNQLCTEGGKPVGATRRYPWMFLVYDHRVAQFRSQQPPALADYRFPYDPERMPIGENSDELIDAVQIVYTDTDGVERVSPFYYQPGVDRTSRYLRTHLLSGAGSANSALATVQTYLDEHRYPQLAGTLSVPDWQGIAMRTGQWVQFLGYDGPFALITQTTTDWMTGDTALTIGQPAAESLPRLLQDAVDTAVAARQNRNVITGARQTVRLLPVR